LHKIEDDLVLIEMLEIVLMAQIAVYLAKVNAFHDWLEQNGD
jgi:hypothetical protein